MQKEDNDTSVTNEDTEILNLPLYTESVRPMVSIAIEDVCPSPWFPGLAKATSIAT